MKTKIKRTSQYSNVELINLRKILLELVNEINKICQKHNIKYFAIGGTAIGAVRHKGFIPWDDDLDIAMSRENYDNFIKACKEELAPSFFLLNFKSEPNYYAYFTKLCKKGTQFVEKETKNLKYEHGIFVDIFVYDVIPDEPRLRKKYCSTLRIKYELYKSKSLWGISNLATKKNKVLGLLLRPILHVLLLGIPKKCLYASLDKSLTKYKNKRYKYCTYMGKLNESIETNSLENIVFMPFETTEIMMLKDYDNYLTKRFGNYMSLPPVEQRINHCPLILKTK